MIFISHRGNLTGPNPKEENKIDYILNALNEMFEVEVDLWFKNNKFYLGHDEPQFEVNVDFFDNKKIWIHTKNLECFYELSKYNLNFFWHENDKIVVTSKGYLWNYPGTLLSERSICVLPEIYTEKKVNCLGICSDYIKNYYDRYNNI
tara:strand:- start:10 stop:453 length:444 start_codon:yes stop_codon:yes gene_type:complete